MTNTITILAIVVLVGFGVQSAYACTESDVQHWGVVAATPFQSFIHPSLGNWDAGFRNIILELNPDVPIIAGVIAAEKLNEDGWTVLSTGDPITPSDFNLVFLEHYSTICKDGFEQIIGGMLLQPDAMTLALAYGIANSVWMAPLVIGIGAGIYLTKSKWKR